MLSPERKNRVTGSQAGAILGLSPWKTREDVIKDWLYGSDFEGNAATAYGTFHEEHAVADLEITLGKKVTRNEKFFIHPEHDWLGCTPDGFVDDYVIEIKCPYGLRDEKEPQFKSIHEQPHYYAQVQLEMYCTGKEWAIFYQWNKYRDAIQFIRLDNNWIEDNIILLHGFIEEVAERKLEIDSDEQLALAFKEAKAAVDSATAALDIIKQALIDKAKQGNASRKFGTVNVIKQERSGTVSYASIVKDHLPDLDLSPYTGEPSTVWIVKG